ncbi:hypothetical protein UFOVP260_50 [uncultured Caudovirales phage]|uniref:Uncharacterized protein n=1 Tax=uncultured Caudovirales phage TaxID=2100421 RepID=A0A6J5KWN9_9CAUD|nr:hypothetical protein UFOVP85_12 [uncultured Caudovirales phage]CAB4132671.1 hypothetical protein UFOVP260_50 [uncultured Caudovirales phage]CAB4202987.1 hypothetical protein UFOVP1363_55 [uncultured Caudovirales phage]CAB5207173.1 hypothetical protein UFOVP179_29 [uncultured Caudovirales phage]
MALIYQFPTPIPVTNGNYPQFKFAVFGDNLTSVTTAGYLNSSSIEAGLPLGNADVIMALYSFVPQTNTGSFGIFTVSIAASNGQITLTAWGNPGDVVLPTIANYIAHFTNTSGTLSSNAVNVINAGNIQAGLSGTAGTLASFPATSAKGSLIVAAVANTGNTNTTISNVAMGQASVISIPDPGAATADFVVAPSALVSGNFVKASGTAGLVVDGGAALHAGTTGTYGGGGTSNAFTVTGMASTWIVTASILTQTNAASIVKVVPSTNTLTITFSADPGAGTTVSWIAFTAAI